MSAYPCLVLAPWMAPHQVVPWQKAICMVFTDELQVLEQYDEAARSPSITIRFPCVARLTKRMPHTKKDIKFSRPNVYARDRRRCQYCGAKPETDRGLNYDHVKPRSKGGKTTFENIVTSCVQCNLRKGDKTPEQAGLTLRSVPQKPRSLPITPKLIGLPAKVPELWLPYLHDRLASVQVEVA